MADEQFQIRIKKGYSKKLRFHFAPVSDAIMKADADWLTEAEISCSFIHTRKLVYPFIKKYFPGKFVFEDELNLMPFEDAERMARQLRKVARLLEKDYMNPRLASYKKLFSIELLVSPDEYEERYEDASSFVREQGIRENISVVTTFYRRLSSWILETIEEYGPKGCNAIAIWAPH